MLGRKRIVKTIDIAKEFWPDLNVPQYIPEGYELESLIITREVSGDIEAEYRFNSEVNNYKLHIRNYNFEYGLKSQEADDVIELADRVIHIYKDDLNNYFVINIFLDDCEICICGDLSKNEFIKIANTI